MPRKTNPSQKSLLKTVNKEVSLVNRQFRNLEKAGLYGKYGVQKHLIMFAKENPELKIVKEKGTNKHKLVFTGSEDSSVANLRLIRRRLENTRNSTDFTVVGLRHKQREAKIKAKDTISGYIGRKATNKDFDRLIEISEYGRKQKEYSIVNQMGDSDFFALVETAKDYQVDEKGFWNMVKDYIEIDKNNSSYFRNEAKELYKKFVLS